VTQVAAPLGITGEPATAGHDTGRPIAILALTALGVVFGDLGTSPLYALQEAFHGSRGVAATEPIVVGIVSLFIWSLVLMVSVKYVAMLMRAGNRGEGGVLALLALLVSGHAPVVRRAGLLVGLASLGAAMLYGDGVITPAISVLSAVEGLRIATPVFEPYVVPITVVILIGLFASQQFGSIGLVWAIAGTLFVADCAFVLGNLFKFMDGGWLPLALGIVFTVMTTWLAGRRRLAEASRERSLPIDTFLASLAINPPHRIRGTAVFLAAETHRVPLVLLHHLKHNQALHETVILLTVTTEEVPRVNNADRVRVEPLTLGFVRVVARFGFMEEPDVPRVVAAAARLRGLKDEESRTTYYLGRLSVVPPSERRRGRMPRWRVSLFGYLKRNERSASMYFEIPPNRVVELGTRVEL
jgi:K+ transporter